MTNSYQLTTDAERDIIDIYIYSVEQFGAAKAESYVDALYLKFAQLADNPALGRDFGDIHPGTRRSNQISHAIYFKSLESGILVLRILHQSMDPARHLGRA